MSLPVDPLQSVVGEVEGHVAEAGWDQPAQLFALVQTEQLLRTEPHSARLLRGPVKPNRYPATLRIWISSAPSVMR